MKVDGYLNSGTEFWKPKPPDTGLDWTDFEPNPNDKVDFGAEISATFIESANYISASAGLPNIGLKTCYLGSELEFSGGGPPKTGKPFYLPNGENAFDLFFGIGPPNIGFPENPN